VIRVPVGSSIRFLNSDVQDHVVVGRAGTWASGVLTPGDEFDVTFRAKGTFPYACSLHPGMVGTVIVGDGIGLAGGAAVGQPETVVPTTLPSIATSPEASVTAGAAATPAGVRDRPASSTASDQGAIAIAVILGGAGGILLGAVGTGVILSRRRTGAAATR
jgi:hypothetical protein